MTRILRLRAVGVGVFATLAVIYSAAQTRNPQERVLRASAGRSILAQIRMSDTEVTVVSSTAPPLSVAPAAGTDPIVWLTGLSDAVLIVDIKSRKSELTEDKDWIRSEVTAEVQDVLKYSRERPFRVTEDFTFYEEGGRLLHQDVAINAVVPWARPVAVGSRYLMFVNIGVDQEIVVGPGSTYLDSGAGFVSLSEKEPDVLRTLGPSKDVVIGKIKAIGRLQPR